MENKVCLDTDMMVDFLRDKEYAVAFIQQNEMRVIFAMTSITLFELYYGAYKSKSAQNLIKLEELQQRMRILPTSTESMRKAGEILAALEQQGNTLDFRDLLIGSITLTEHFAIKTNNKKHFSRIPGLTVL